MTDFTMKNEDAALTMHVKLHIGDLDYPIAPGATGGPYTLDKAYDVTSPDGSAVGTFHNASASGTVVVTGETSLRLAPSESGPMTVTPTVPVKVRHAL